MINGKDFKVNELSPALPDVSPAVDQFLQYVSIGIVTSQQINGKNQEVITYSNYRAVKQPMNRALEIKQEGERDWRWFTIHALPDLVLQTDDVIVFGGLRYRVMNNRDYKEYGYVEYEVVEDYQNQDMPQ